MTPKIPTRRKGSNLNLFPPFFSSSSDILPSINRRSLHSMSSVWCSHKKWILRDDKWTRRDFRPHRIINQIFGLDEPWRRKRKEARACSSKLLAGFNDYLLGKSVDARVKHDTQRSFYRFRNLLVCMFYFFDLAQSEHTTEWKILLRQLTSILILDNILGICLATRKEGRKKGWWVIAQWMCSGAAYSILGSWHKVYPSSMDRLGRRNRRSETCSIR